MEKILRIFCGTAALTMILSSNSFASDANLELGGGKAWKEYLFVVSKNEKSLPVVSPDSMTTSYDPYQSGWIAIPVVPIDNPKKGAGPF